MLAPWKKSYDQPRQHFKKQRHYFANKGPYRQSYSSPSSHVWMWELDYKESWAPKNWCFWTVVLEKTLWNPLDSKAIQPVHPKGNQSWILIGRMDAEPESPILWPPDAKNWFIGKDPDAACDSSSPAFHMITLHMNHNQDCPEKYQQPQICRWFFSIGRKWKETKESLDEGERGEWKSWLKAQ